MVVLLDLEWISDNGDHLTQLSARRVDRDWNEQSCLDVLVQPPEHCFAHRGHMAFGGLDEALYRSALPVGDCMLTFSEWLEPWDTVWVWSEDTLRLLDALWKATFPIRSLPICYTANQAAHLAAMSRGITLTSFYSMLRLLKLELPGPEHLASSDTEALSLLFRALAIPAVGKPKAPPPVISRAQRRERVRAWLSSTEYNYIYLKHSRVFHCRECAAILNTPSTDDILGSIYYITAASGRRPCKLCKPQPTENIIDKSIPLVSAESTVNSSGASGRKIVYVKLLTGEKLHLRCSSIVGWCRYRLHPGAVTKSLMISHKCLEKECPFLRRNEDNSYWKAKEERRQARLRRKEKARQARQDKAAEEADLLSLAEEWQDYLDEHDMDMYIVRVERLDRRRYKIFYVSDDPMPDWDKYPEFRSMLQFHCPGWSFHLQRIRDVDGSLVTTDRYFSRRRK